MAQKLPQNHGNRSAPVGHGNRGTMLCYLLALLARLERTAGPPTAALPQISQMEPIKTPFPRAQRRSLGPSSPAQCCSAATQRRRRAQQQQHPTHHSGKDQNRFPLWESSSARDPALGRRAPPRGFAPLYFAFKPPGSELPAFLKGRAPKSRGSGNLFRRCYPKFRSQPPTQEPEPQGGLTPAFLALSLWVFRSIYYNPQISY